MAFEFSKRSRDRMEGVHPDIVAVMELALSRSPIDFTVIEGVRSEARQRELVRKGASKTMNSRHLTGHAIDVAPLDDGEVSWSWPLYHKLAPVIKRAADDLGVDLEWGGDWRTFKDGPHWQLAWNAYDKDDMTPRAGQVPTNAIELPAPVVVAPAPRPQATPPAPATGLNAVLGKYAPQGSNTARMGYALITSGLLVYLSQDAVPALKPVVQLLHDAKLISPDATGVSTFSAGLALVFGRAAVRDV